MSVATVCGYRFELFDDKSTWLFVCENQEPCRGNPHVARLKSGDSSIEFRFANADDIRQRARV